MSKGKKWVEYESVSHILMFLNHWDTEAFIYYLNWRDFKLWITCKPVVGYNPKPTVL